MSAKTIRSTLGQLQDDPENTEALAELRAAVGYDAETGKVTYVEEDLPRAELAKLLEAARKAHEARREYDAVANVLRLELGLSAGSEAELGLARELGRVLDDELLDDEAAVKAYGRVLELAPGDDHAEEAIERSTMRRAKWRELVTRYVEEARSASDTALKSSFLVSAAETAFRYGRPELAAKGKKGKAPRKVLLEEVVSGLSEALEIDPKNRRAALLLEHVYREEERFEELAQAMERFALESSAKDEKVAGYLRLGRLTRKRLAAPERAATAYERVLELSPGHPEAISFLANHFTEKEMWDHLVALYEEQLAGGGVRGGQEAGTLLQIAMVHWRMRKRPEQAEPYFERLRKMEPAQPVMLAFFREVCVERGESQRLAAILGDAQRALPEAERAKIATEIAKLAEEGANAAKAIEQWRALHRQDPSHAEARVALRRLYRQTSGWNALADLLRGELERIAPEDADARLPVLREIAQVYRDHLKSDSALVAVLTQIVTLAPQDADALRELSRVYEALQRWRDLLTTQARLAELEPDAGARAEIYRGIARRWIEQFSNVQNAVEAYEKLREAAPLDPEALEKLKELYGKRRTYNKLYELHEAEVAAMAPGAERRAITLEMAKLAAERLDRGADAVRLYKLVLEEEPSYLPAIDALEKQSERDKDFRSLAEVLERRVELATDDAQRLQVLQKLGAVYTDRLSDSEGASRTWTRVLELSPNHPKALRALRDRFLETHDFDALTAMYDRTQDYEGLAEVLSGAADKASDPEAKVELSFRAAAVYRDNLRAPERAFRAYERVLAVRPTDERAASELVPLYESDEKWGRLPPLYEVLLGHAKDDGARRALLQKLVVTTGDRLQDRSTAFSWARKVYDLDPTREGALAALEAVTRSAGKWSELVEILRGRLAKGEPSAAEARSLKLAIAEIAARELGSVDEAVATYRSLYEADETDEEVGARLDALLRAEARHDDLRWLLRRRVDRAEGSARLDLLAEWATLEEEGLESPERAVALYREILDGDPSNKRALRAVARLLRHGGDAAGAAAAIERERDLAQGKDLVARELELAELYMGSLGRPVDALAAAERALAAEPNAPEAVAVVEKLLPVAETRGRAAVVLEESYAATGRLEKQAEVLGVRIATAVSRQDRLPLFERLADVHEKQGAFALAFDVVARAVDEIPSELALWDRLGVLANQTQRTQAFVDAIAASVPRTGPTSLPLAVELDLAERAATLYDENLGDSDAARPYLERILKADPKNERAFARLRQNLTAREKWADLEAAYEQVIAAQEGEVRASLLVDVATLVEEIVGEPTRAVGYYERILETLPDHDQAVSALDKLYAASGEWRKLSALLQRKLGNAIGDEATTLRLRLGRIFHEKLSEPGNAIGYLEEVLADDPTNREAKDLVEATLAVPELRKRAAGILEGVYSHRGESRDLVRILEVRLEFATDRDERRDLLRRVADLRDEKLTDDAGALDAYARLVPLTPEDVDNRRRFLEISARHGAMAKAAEVLREAAEAASAPQPRADILLEVAKIHEGSADATRAEGIYREVLELDREDPTVALPAARSLERIYGATGRSKELAEMIRVQVKLEVEPDARRALLGRLGALCEEQLSDLDAAVGAWKERLEDDPTDDEALVALDRLYERKGDARALVDILRSRERLAQGADARKTFMVRAAATLDEKLGDIDEAILAYRAVLDDFGPERSILASLARLYERAKRNEDLAETLVAELGLVDVVDERLDLLTRLGDVRRNLLGEVDAAIDAYREALTLSPSHAKSREAVEALLDHETARKDAADLLRPLYEADDAHEKLLRVLDIQIDGTDGVDEKLQLLALAADVAEGRLHDATRAFVYAARGTRHAAAETQLGEWLQRVERLAEKNGDFKGLCALLREVAGDILDEDRQVAVLLRVADLGRDKLDDLDLAREYYEKALELRGDDEHALLALEAIFEGKGADQDLYRILKRRGESARTDGERRTVYMKEARLLDEKLGEKVSAIEVYERILDLGLEADAIASLERLYASEGRWEDLVALHERRLSEGALSDSDKAALHHALGGLREARLGDAERAFDEYVAALTLVPQHAPTVASLEALMKEQAHAARSAEILEGVYLARHEWRKVMSTLEARLGASQDPDERRQLLRRLSKLEEEQSDDLKAALDVTARLLAEDVTDESTWAELERLARAANAERRLAEVYASELEKIASDEPATAKLAERTGELFEQLGDIDRALVFFRRAYAFAPEDQKAAFDAIDRLLTKAKRPVERVALYRESLDHRHDSSDRVRTLHVIAGLQEAELGDDAAAIETYRAAVDTEDTDTTSLDALTRLFAKNARWDDLSELLRRRAEQSAMPEEEARFRFDLATVLREKVGDVSRAVDEYQAIVELLGESPRTPYRETVAALESLLSDESHKVRVVEILRPLYERADDWQHIVSVNEHRLAIAQDSGERVGVLRENARLLEQRGNDPHRAFEALRQAFVLDPDDGETREELDRLAVATSRWDDLAETYERGIEATDGVGKRELLEALAKLHDKRRDDPRRALDAYDRLFRLDESEIHPLDEMVDLATLLSDWPTLVRVLTKRVELIPSDDERASTWRRIGEAKRDMLDDAQGATEAYERALDLEPESAFTLDNLIPLYEAKNDAARLVDLYRRRIELCGEDDEGLKLQLLLDAAERYEKGLGERREAIQALTEALEVRPDSVDVLERLGALYETEGMYAELHENLRARAGLEADSDKRRALKKRVGGLLAKELDDPAQALVAYSDVLAMGFDPDAIAAIRAIGEAREELRHEAAESVTGILLAEGKYAELVDVLELRLRAETEPFDRARTLRQIAEYCENRVESPDRALGALLRSLAEEPGDAPTHTDIERLCKAVGKTGFEKYADTLRERATSTFDSTVTADLYARLGRIERAELGNARKAAEAFQHAAEQGGDTTEVLVALESVFSELGDSAALADVLERRIALETEAEPTADLVHRLACLQIDALGEKAQGLATLRTALEKVPSHSKSRELMEKLLDDTDLFEDAFESLEAVYRQLSLSKELGDLFARRVARADGRKARVAARLDHAKILENEVRDVEGAQRAIEAAISDDPLESEAQAELERLAGITGRWASAADALAASLDASAEGKTLSTTNLDAFGEPVTLWIRLAGWRRDRANDPAGAEVALRKAIALDKESLDALRELEALLRVSGRERDLVEVLRHRAKLETDPSDKKALLREAKEVSQNTLGDVALAEAALRELLAENEADDWALAELVALREHAGDFAEVTTLLLKRAENVMDGNEALELRRRAAEVVLEKLDDKPRAISLQQEILDSEPGDEKAARALRSLFAETGRDKDLAKLLATLVDNATSVEERVALRLDLAKLQMEKFAAPNDAIDTLTAVLDEDPDQGDAALALSEILEKTGQDDKLADLLDTQIARAKDRGDTTSELALKVRLGQVLEGRLKDTGRALATYEAVLEQDASHRGALEAVARITEARSDYERAASALGKLVDISEAADAKAFALRLADVRQAKDDLDGMEDALRRAIALVPPGLDVRPRLLAAFEKRKKWAELAEMLVEEAELSKPAVVPSLPATGSLPPPAEVVGPVKLLRRAAEIHLSQRKSPADAVPVLEKATELVPADRELLLMLCDAYTAAGREQDATVVLERIIASFGQKRTKELSVFHHRLGKALAQIGNKDSALTQLDMAFKIDPGSVPVLRDLGVLALDSGDLERAQKTFRALLLQRLEPGSGISKGEVFFYLGDISMRQGDAPKAKQMLERALENEPGLERAKSMLDTLKS